MLRFILAQFLLGLYSFSLCLAEPLLTIKIVNGTPAGSYPWMAAIVLAQDNTSIVCGGQLIHPRYIMTAAHCAVFIKRFPEEFRIVTGRSRLTASGGVVSEIEGAIPYPLYKQGSNAHDVALIKLKTPVPGAVVSLLTLDQASLAAAGLNATILGWGTMDPDFPAFPDALQEATIPILSDDSCEARYGLMFKGSSMMCAGKLETSSGAGDGIDSCQGDSGGPLTVVDGSGQLKLAGVTSWGFSCAGRRYPGVYAEVAPYTTWAYSYPLIPPVIKDPLVINGDFKVGETLTCQLGSVLGDQPITVTYKWSRSEPDDFNFKTIPGQTSNTYTLTDQDEGKLISCDVKAENSSGSDIQTVTSNFTVEAAAVIEPTATPTSAPTEEPTPIPTTTPTATPTSEPTVVKKDSEPPKASLLKRQAARSVYQLVFTASDDAGENNISRIEATSVRTANELCKPRNKKSTKRCNTTKSEFFIADSVDGLTWTITLPRRAQPDKYTLFVRAVDKSGNVQSSPTRVVLIVKQKR